MTAQTNIVGRVLGTEDATPLEFWVAVREGEYLQLDDVVALERALPDGSSVQIFGLVIQVRARHEGVRFDSDVFLIQDGVLPGHVSQAAKVMATRFEPEVFVPPLPGGEVRRARGAERERALFFDGMEPRNRLGAGLSRDEEPVYLNLEFIDGTRGAHVNISGISGVATKTSYATFLLYSLFHSDVLGADRLNTKALIYNVKGEDLLFLDHENANLPEIERMKYQKLGLAPEAFRSVELWAPPRRDDRTASPDVATRHTGVKSYFWTISEFCREGLLPFLFADAEDDRQQYTMVISNVMAKLKDAVSLPDGGAQLEGREVRTFRELAKLVEECVQDESTRPSWVGLAMGQGTVNAFLRRLYGAVRHVEHLVRGDIPNADRHMIRHQAQVSVVDLHNLSDRAQRFVVGVTLRRAFDDKEKAGVARPLLFVVLDELNKYAPREGTSPIKETLLDVAERGRSLGIILIGAEQTASEVERRVIGNSAVRVVGRLDTAEAGRDEYGFLPAVHRQRATIVKPGTMILSQPELPIPLVTRFPFPSWATRKEEARVSTSRRPPPKGGRDPFEGLA
ncbi:MAG TPA: ATP-binding protein [Vicinamibacteria bacterium]|nr:ATP-binding protein [Vicinamibacteria bacterium]